MIRNFTDHAANERTFLAWVRTAIAIVGFGIIIERIDLFGATDRFGSMTGLLLVVAGIALFVVATYRFVTLRRLISDDAVHPILSAKVDILLAVVLGALAIAIAVFALHVAGPGG